MEKLDSLLTRTIKNILVFLIFKLKNIDMEINTVFFDSGLESIKINKLRSPNQDFKMDYNFKDWHLRLMEIN